MALKKGYQELYEKKKGKKKFRFTKRVFKKEQLEEEEDVYQETDEIKASESDLLISKKKGEKLVIKREEQQHNLLINDLEDCEITVEDCFKSFFCRNLKNCSILLGVIEGGSHLTKIRDSKVSLCTHQLRIHDSERTEFSVITRSNPIIEKSLALTFSQYPKGSVEVENKLEEEKMTRESTKWSEVKDFDWHKQEQSPNFQIKLDN